MRQATIGGRYGSLAQSIVFGTETNVIATGSSCSPAEAIVYSSIQTYYIVDRSIKNIKKICSISSSIYTQ